MAHLQGALGDILSDAMRDANANGSDEDDIPMDDSDIIPSFDPSQSVSSSESGAARSCD